jgi:hydrogenase maturation protease
LHKLLDPFLAINHRPVTAMTVIVGLGSAHGDDQIGWRVAERLAATIADESVLIRTACSPGELFDWLDGVDRLIVCDACQNMGTPGATRRLHWPNARLAVLRSSGSHDIGLADVLALADQLCRLPKEVIIWCAEGQSRAPNAPLSCNGQAAVERLVDEITQELYAQGAAAG